MNLTGNSVIDYMIANKRQGRNGEYVRNGFAFKLYDDHCVVGYGEDSVDIMYNYTPEETNLCLGMMNNYSLYQVQFKSYGIVIFCNGIIKTDPSGDELPCFMSRWFSKMSSIEYITKTKKVIEEMRDNEQEPLSKEEFIELYNSGMSPSLVKNARKV